MTDGLRLDLVGKAKSSPDRRLRARARFTLDGNGDGWSTVEFLGRGDDPLGQSEAYDSPWDTRGFGRVEKSVRWTDPASVSLVPWWGLGPWESQVRVVAAPVA